MEKPKIFKNILVVLGVFYLVVVGLLVAIKIKEKREVRKKAEEEKAVLLFVPESYDFEVGEERDIQIRINFPTDLGLRIDGVKVVFEFPTEYFEMRYFEEGGKKIGIKLADNGLTKVLHTTIPEVANGAIEQTEGGRVGFVVLAESPNSGPEAKGSVLLATVRMRAKKAVDQGSFSFVPEKLEIVGGGKKIDLATADFSFSVKEGEKEITPTTPPPSGPVINFKIKFRNINHRIDNQVVRVKIKKQGMAKEYQTEVSSNDKGVLSGSVVLAGVTPGDGYRIWIKGPKHLATVFCRNNQKERGCGMGEGLTIQEGENTFDFSSLPLEPGDIAGAEDGGQDGVVDNEDLEVIVDAITTENEELVAKADLNYNGAADGGDIREYFLTLSARYDDDI